MFFLLIIIIHNSWFHKMELALDSANNIYVAGNTSVKLGETDPH